MIPYSPVWRGERQSPKVANSTTLIICPIEDTCQV
jgi:hypothetical protein